MTRKSDFDAEQWSTLTAAPALAATAVAAAARGGTLREGISMARAYQEARQAEHTELVEAILTSPPAVERPATPDPAALADLATAQVRAASDLLREKGTDADLIQYGDFVLAVCTAVARAHKEGGVLGIGGTLVSPAEQAVLDRVALELGPRPDTA